MSILARLVQSPGNLDRLAEIVLPWVGSLSVGILILGLYFAFFDSPPDYRMGDSVRIMYIHVPSSWIAIGSYILMAAASAIALIRKLVIFEIIVRSLSPVGICFCLVSLLTGSIWGKPMWGTWWVWDGRLASMSVLLMLYLGYQILVMSSKDPNVGARAGQYLIIIGIVNLPVIRWSVIWWATLHQPASIFLLKNSSIHPVFLTPLLLMNITFLLIFLLLFLLRFRLEFRRHLLRQKRLVGPSND